jgi:hypothetical protein
MTIVIHRTPGGHDELSVFLQRCDGASGTDLLDVEPDERRDSPTTRLMGPQGLTPSLSSA